MPTPQEAAAILKSALASGFDPTKLALLRKDRLRELEHNRELEQDSEANAVRSRVESRFASPSERRRDAMMGWDLGPSRSYSGATDSDVNNLNEDIHNDPFTGDAEQARLGGIQRSIDTANTTMRPDVADAAKTTTDRNAFAAFMLNREGNRGKFAAEISPEGTQAQDADSRRKQAENMALARARGGTTVAPRVGPSDYSVEHNARSRQSVDELLKKVGPWTTGIGSLLHYIPATDARNFAAEMDTLKANIAFNELTAMREASKTGGALGQVSDRENALLTASLGALDPGQSPANLKAQLQKIGESLDRWKAAQLGTSSQQNRIVDPNWGR